MRFLNEQSLRIVWSASRYSQPPLHFPGIISDSTNLQLTQSGCLRRIVIAAKFNATAHVGWPEIQILIMGNSRVHGSGTNDIAVCRTNKEPRSTGYLNIYEYELNSSVAVQIGDEVAISWHGNISQPDQIRYSLAYYVSSGSRVPMVSIVVGDCVPEMDLLVSNALHCKEMKVTSITSDSPGPTNIISTPDTEIKLSTTSDETIIICGTVVFSILLIILLIFVVVLTFVVKRRRKSAAMSATDPIEMSTQPRMLHNTPSKSANNFDNKNFIHVFSRV